MDGKNIDLIVENLTGLVKLMHMFKDSGHAGGIKPYPLDPHNWTLLFLQNQNLTMTQLGNLLYRSKPNMTTIIDKLITEGLVSRLPDEKDRRIIRIMITDKGKNMIKAKKLEMGKALRANMTTLDDEDLAIIGVKLGEINLIMQKAGDKQND